MLLHRYAVYGHIRYTHCADLVMHGTGHHKSGLACQKLGHVMRDSTHKIVHEVPRQ